ncbi:hypothetical protein [Oscillatoria salina]|uniref:hypothetical protein n=1 Tax=Oscillatoria salina TaxID=331517 RepID=UPI0013BD5A6E|nr:hypothetical protein [Oscillatoria salina]MBZ8180197.1 hypothetical protein [Oscillatoria salina IIICB1]NET90271.1 hypothetical protein [Kamptonema sp. SIO1D9]
MELIQPTNDPNANLRKFEIAIKKLASLWQKYQPKDNLSQARKEDLLALQKVIFEYKDKFQSADLQASFWQGYFEGKSERRVMKKRANSSKLKALIDNLTSGNKQKTTDTFELGVQTGWRYARLKSYLLRIKNEQDTLQQQQLAAYGEFIAKIKEGCSDSDDLNFTF